ncbi:hypothetical protein HJC23_002046 [Cyclotella cryptica]|uniref:Sodium/calcium exchanger membrane region domain-containing protein n=1 Tax=Cyclotella cryptica TaxID=29204 RepID=A0ABD3Q578_9STRA
MNVSVAIVALVVSATVQFPGLNLFWKHRIDQAEQMTAIKVMRKLNEHNSSATPEVDNPPCSDILLHETPQERCQHALDCDGEYLMKAFLPLAFCMNDSDSSPLEAHPTIRVIFPVIFPIFMILLTVLLFRLLASTAEDYFSPALEMISSEFQVPPPLAGVTLLALGNGSPDVSAVCNAIRSNPSEGIPLSLGELTGGGMFVQSIVVGRIVSIGRKTKGDEERGVICREELIRDMSMYAIAAGYVFWMCAQETIYYRHVMGMFVLYSGYVMVVVAFEVRRYYSICQEDSDESNMVDEERPTNNLLAGDIESTPSRDEDDHATLELSQTRRLKEDRNRAQDFAKDPPGSKHSARIIRVVTIQKDRQKKRRIKKRSSTDVISRRTSKPTENPQMLYENQKERIWSISLLADALLELREHFYEVIYVNGFANEQNSTSELLLSLLEAPFVAIRKFVIPLPCEGDYNRSMVALSIALSPLWLCTYLTLKIQDFDPFSASIYQDDKLHIPFVFWPCCLSLTCGCAVLGYAPKGNVAMPLRYTVPVALYGFLIAATWIDVISDQLVNVLEFVGLVLRIPSPVMGMTVLAWGNSVGDYSTNSALAQKGFSDMSMAACFAGPAFNLLIGLGSGLLSQKDSLMSEDGLHFVSMIPSVKTGFLFLLSNCILGISCGVYHRGLLPSWYSYVFFAMYLCFMTMNAQHLLL